MCKVLTVFIIASVYFFKVAAQNFPVYYSYYVNPYLYNPAEVATEYTYVFINYRQQWVGIEEAPRLTTFNVNTQLKESRAGIGAKISNYTRSVLNTSDVSLTFGYSVPLTEKSKMFFGLSVGAITNNIDLNKVSDPSDPALVNYLANNVQPAASFGFLYRTAAGINFGIALPQLFKPDFNNTSHFENTSVAPLDNIIITAYYKREVEGRITNRKRRNLRKRVLTRTGYAPLELYTMYMYSSFGTSQAMATAKINFSQYFWAAGSYRLEYGFGAGIGFALNKFLLCYSYEPGNQPEPGFSTGTHEVQLGLRLGERKQYKKNAPVLRSQIQRPSDEKHLARFQQDAQYSDDITQKESSTKKYYVVVRSFSGFEGADIYKKKLISEKFNANIFYYNADKKYHVYVHETIKSSEAYDEARKIKAYTKLKDTHVLIVTEPK